MKFVFNAILPLYCSVQSLATRELLLDKLNASTSMPTVALLMSPSAWSQPIVGTPDRTIVGRNDNTATRQFNGEEFLSRKRPKNAADFPVPISGFLARGLR
jgi:hypothetical protein